MNCASQGYLLTKWEYMDTLKVHMG
jgi:hypothetical protein